MLKYSEWNEKLLEFVDEPDKAHKNFIDKHTNTIKNLLNDTFGDIIIVPYLDKFTRENEPLQYRSLFTTRDLFSIGANFEENGKLHSVDFFKPSSTGSELTMYIKKGEVEDITKIITKMMKNPKPINKEEVQELVTENEQNVQVEFKHPPLPEIKKGELYDYGDPDVVFSDLSKYTQMVIDKKMPSLIVTGPPGVGKTHHVLGQLTGNSLKKGEDFVHIKGRSTSAGLYIALYENKNRILVIDDCDSVFKNEDAINILKSALDSYDEREISWLVGKPMVSPSSGKRIPTKFLFEGAVIFISNLPQKKIDYALKSRSFVLEVALTPEDMIQYMRKQLPKVEPQLPLHFRETALELIESVYKTAENLELSMRTLKKALKILEETDNLKEAKRLIIQQCSYK